MKKLLITGAYGLVGSNICKILEEKYPLIEVTKVKAKHNIHEDEIYDYIINAAGYGQPKRFCENTDSTLMLNTLWTGRLFEKLNRDGKFLFISSSEVYSGAQAPYTEDMIGTTTPQHPRACYIEGKRCGEAVCMSQLQYGFDVKIARLALAYGPGVKKGDTRVINQFIEQALDNKVIKMLDDGSSVRTYLYVKDAAEMLLNILFRGKKIVYNVGGKDTMRIKDLAARISEYTLCSLEDGEHGLNDAPDNVTLDISKYLNEFPEQKFTSFDDGLKETIQWIKSL